MKLYMFRTVPLSSIRSFSLYKQQWYMSYRFADSCRAGSGCSMLILLASSQQTCLTYTIAVCTVENSWWWTEELSETCRVSFQNKNVCKISASSWFIIRILSKVLNIWMRIGELWGKFQNRTSLNRKQKYFPFNIDVSNAWYNMKLGDRQWTPFNREKLHLFL